MRPRHLEFMAQLKGIARNLNQLTRTAHAAGFGAVAKRHRELVTEIERIVKALRRDR